MAASNAVFLIFIDDCDWPHSLLAFIDPHWLSSSTYTHLLFLPTPSGLAKHPTYINVSAWLLSWIQKHTFHTTPHHTDAMLFLPVKLSRPQELANPSSSINHSFLPRKTRENHFTALQQQKLTCPHPNLCILEQQFSQPCHIRETRYSHCHS